MTRSWIHWLQQAACATAIRGAGSLLVGVRPAHALSAIAAAVMSGALIVALAARPTARLLDVIAGPAF